MRGDRPADHLPLRRGDPRSIGQQDRTVHHHPRGAQHLRHGRRDRGDAAGKVLFVAEGAREQSDRLRHSLPLSAGAALPAHRVEDLR